MPGDGRYKKDENFKTILAENKYFCFMESVETDSYLCRHVESVDDSRCYGCAYIGMGRDTKAAEHKPRETGLGV